MNFRTGTISSSQLKQLVSAGELSTDDLVWREGLSNWIPARQVKNLFSVPPLAERRPSPPPLPLPTLAYDDDVPPRPTNDRVPQKDSVWLWIGGSMLVLAGFGACVGTSDKSPTIIAAPLLIVAGGLLLPSIWRSIIAKWPVLRLHSKSIRISGCVVALAVLGMIPPDPHINRPRKIDGDNESGSEISAEQAAANERSEEIIAHWQKMLDETKREQAKWSSRSRGKVLSKDAYLQIENGMSYQTVVAIVGTAGEEQSSNRIDGVPGVIDSIDTVMYSWRNGDGSNMNVMFQNDKVVSKAQFGLR